MKMQAIPRFRWATALLCAVMILATSGLAAADEKDKAGAPPAKKKAEPKGTLPAHYGDVVSGDQREKIYAILASYKDKITKLKQDLDTLEEARDKEVEAVLTPDQKEKVAKAKADAAAKSKAKKAEAAKKKNGDPAPAPAAGGTTKPGGGN